MEIKTIRKKKFFIRLFILLLITAAVFLLVKNDYILYNDTIGTVTSAEQEVKEVRKGFDGKREYEETYYLQTLTLKLRNGEHAGETLTAQHTCTSSGVYDTAYKKGDDVFVEKIGQEN